MDLPVTKTAPDRTNVIMQRFAFQAWCGRRITTDETIFITLKMLEPASARGLPDNVALRQQRDAHNPSNNTTACT